MSFESIIALIIVVAVIIIATAIIMRMTNNKKKVVRFVKSRCANQIAVLLNKEKITSEYTFTSEEEDIICSLSLEDWKHWIFQVKDAKETAKKYPLAFDDFIAESFPQIYSRKCFEKSKFTSTARKRESLIDSMTSEELSLVLAETSDNWNARIKRNSIASEIKRTNRDGYTTYCEVLKKASLSTTEIIRDKKAIIEYQKAYEKSKIYDGWVDKQKGFCESYYNICKEVRESDGRFTYQVKFNHNDKFGKSQESEFKVWQGFLSSFSYECDDIQPEHMISTRNNLDEWKNRSRYYYNRVYDGLYNLIESLTAKRESKPLIVFVNSSKYNWGKESYNYHYKYLRNKLVENDYVTIDFESIYEIDRDSIYDSVIIIDLLTHNDDLKNNCRNIAEYFTKKQPFIAYYTYLKEYSKAEVERFYKKKESTKVASPAPNPIPSNEQKEIEFIKNLFLKVNKHSFFSYVAITNTLIGEAGGANDVMKVWLDNPAMYHLKTGDCTETKIEGRFSVDGRHTYTVFNMAGNDFSVEDVAKYTYKLFSKMGIWSQFREKGESAINYMNRRGFLSKH